MAQESVSFHHYRQMLSLQLERITSPSLRAVREGLLWLVPCLMVSSFLLFAAAIGDFTSATRPDWVNLLYLIHGKLTDAFPFLLTSAISYILAMQWRLPRPPVALLAMVYLVICRNFIGDTNTMLTFSIIMAIVTPLYAVPILGYLVRRRWLRLVTIDSAGQLVKESLNLVLPALLAGVLVVGISMLIFGVVDWSLLRDWLWYDYASEPYQFGVVFTALNSCLWFLGVHGYYALLPFVESLEQAVTLNYAIISAGGEGVYHMNLSFMGAFVFLGGSGATMSLVVAMLVICRQKSLRVIALASIPIALVNVNELLLFGLPIIFNPRLFFPFLLVPAMNTVVGLTAVELGWVTSPGVSVPFNSPMLVNAWVATNGDINAVLLQLVNVVLGSLVYAPAVMSLEKQFQRKSIHFAAFDTSYTRRQEEAATLLDDPIAAVQRRLRESIKVEHKLESISAKEFYLEYQPQVCLRSGQVCGCEALIRARDEQGNTEPPGGFLPWLEKAGMMKDLDLWVVRQVVKDVQRWTKQGIAPGVSINISPETLVDDHYMKQFIEQVAPCAGSVHFEITEETLLVDQKRLMAVFNRLRQMGVRIYIDDFGTGFSSLSYLNLYQPDAIKIDRSFVLALDNRRGQQVFESLLGIAEKLGLDVVVEGVESEAQLSFVPLQGNISVQGWLYSRSLPVDKFVEYVQRSSRAAISR